MITLATRSRVRMIVIVCAGTVALVGCGSSTSPSAPSAGATPSAAAASASASTPAPSAPVATASPIAGGVCTPTPIKFDPKAIDLNGSWAGDDGGIYYVRQIGNVVWWNGMSSREDPPEHLGRDWNNVGRGEIGDDLVIVSEWADVPRGGIDGGGTVNFKIGADAAGDLRITKVAETGSGRGDTLWTRCTPGFPS
jgi:hypothetical protein